jgi:hypothetical protein
VNRGNTNHRILIGIILVLFLVIVTSAQQGGGVVIGSDTGSTATGTTTGTTGTTATTGGTAGDGSGQPVSNYTVLSKIEEKLHAWSRYISGGVLLAPNTDRHVVRLKITCPYTTQITPDATGYWEDHTFIKAVGVPVGTEIGADPAIPSVFLSPYGNAIIPDPPEVCATVFFGNSISNNTPLANWAMNVQRGTQGILTGGQVKYWAYYLVWGKHWNTETLTWDLTRPPSNLAGWHSTTLNIDKIDLAPISFDSRKVYGKANLDGELPGDPNAEISNNWFNPWIFRGGHFVGNMPYGSSKDQSGLARTQLQLVNEANATNYLAGCVTTFATGMRGTFSAGTIGLYRPSLTEANLTQSQNTIWNTRWTLNPGGTQSGPGDYTTLPYYSVTPTVDDQNNYLNWQMPYSNIIWRTEYGGDGIMTTTPAMWKHVALCQNNEASSTWQYFGSQWLETVPGQMFPLTDSRPRIWKVR